MKLITRSYNPYCPDCGACGERPCCPDSKCKHTENCLYPEIYVKLPPSFVPDKSGYYWARDINEYNAGDLYIVNVGWSDLHDSWRVFRFESVVSEPLSSWEFFKGPLRYER